jgi:hypothetical protein
MSGQSAQRARVPVGTAVWVCDPNFITCNPHGEGREHLLAFYEAGYRADLRRLNGHAFLECRQCKPPSFMFAVFTAVPSPMVTLYAIDQASYDEWIRTGEGTPSTPEMLYRLRDPQGRSYNPYWRPPR